MVGCSLQICNEREGQWVSTISVQPSLTSQLRTLEAPESFRRVTAEVGEKVRPVAAVSLGVVGQAQRDRDVGVLRLTRHLDR